jgi:serine-threonine kinase receptor-associated protein
LVTRVPAGRQRSHPMRNWRLRDPLTFRRESIVLSALEVADRAYRKIWDPQTGECLHTLTHNHIVRSVAFPIQSRPGCVATGGREKKLRIFDLTRGGNRSTMAAQDAAGETDPSVVEGHELAPNTHNDTIKSVLWNYDYNIITTADDRNVRWFDLRSQKPIFTFSTTEEIMSCELNSHQTMGNGDAGIISVAAGKSCTFFKAERPGEVLKTMNFDQDIASVAVNHRSGRVVTGGKNETWAHVWDLETEQELGKSFGK